MTELTYRQFYASATRRRLAEEKAAGTSQAGAPEPIMLNYGDPFPASFPNRELADAYLKAVEDDPEWVLQYGGVAAALQGFLVERAATRGMEVSREQILVTNGGSEGIDLVCRLFLEPGDVVMCEAPTFMGALNTFRNFGITCMGVELDEQGLVTSSLEKRLRRRHSAGLSMPKFIYVISNFQNPAGVTMSLERRQELLKLAAKCDFLIVEDDAYGELRFAGEDLPTLHKLDCKQRVLHLGTFSKLIAPGVRVGWIFAPEAVVKQLATLKPGFNNGMALSAVAQYCHDIDFDSRVQWLREEYLRRRDLMLAALKKHMPAQVSWNRPQGGLFIWLELPSGLEASTVAEQALEQGVAVLSGDQFFPDGRRTRHLRLSYSMVSPADLRRGIAVLAKVIESALTADS